MDEARKKLRICLLCVVIVAVIAGCIYYISKERSGKTISEGTLVMREMEGGENYGCGK